MTFNKLMMFCFALMFVYIVKAQSGIEQTVTLDYHELPLRLVLGDIYKKTGISFIFQDQLVDSKKITFHIESAEAGKAITLILNRLQIAYKIIQSNSFVLYDKKPSERKEYVKVVLKKFEPVTDTSVIISEPKIISSIILEYPFTAIKDKKEGKVILKVFVNKEGKVPVALIEKSSGYNTLDSLAIDYSNSLKFIPAKANGLPINIWISVLFNYFYFTSQ